MNSSYDNYNFFFVRRYFLSEAAKLMKYRGFYNLNLISNHNFYNNFYFFLKNLEKNIIFFLFFKNNLIKTNIVPNFLFSKQIFFDFKNFLKFSNKNSIKFLFIKNNDLSKFGFLKNDLYGNNFLLFSNKPLNNKKLIDYKNEYNFDIFLKNNYNFLSLNLIDLSTISYFLNFNLFISNTVDIYKILILLNLNNIFKNN